MWVCNLCPVLLFFYQAPSFAAPGFFQRVNGMEKQPATSKKWDATGYEEGRRFAAQEADYDEVAAIYRAKGIPANWDIFRAEILNKHLGDKDFDFTSFEAGFTRACVEFYEKI